MFHRKCFDGETKGDGVGGIMSKAFHAWCEFQKDKKDWKKFQHFAKKRIKKVGKNNAYDRLKDKNLDEFKKIVQWIEDEEVLLVKRGDYKQ